MYNSFINNTSLNLQYSNDRAVAFRLMFVDGTPLFSYLEYDIWSFPIGLELAGYYFGCVLKDSSQNQVS